MNMQLHTDSHMDAQLAHIPAQDAHTAFYSSADLAQELGVGESTVRTRWFDWIVQVAPKSTLKEARGYTELARTLFHEFAQVQKRERAQWVSEAKSRYVQEWETVGAVEGELMPESVGGALSTIQSSNSDAALALAEEMEAALSFGNQLGEVDAEFSQAEIEAMRLRGARRGIMQFKVEAQAAADTYSQLRQKSMGA